MGLLGCLLGIGIGVGITENSESEQSGVIREVKEVMVTATVLPYATPTARLTIIVEPTRQATMVKATAIPVQVVTTSLDEEVPDSVLRWREWFQVHHPNLLAMQAVIMEVGEDRVIDEEEHIRLCFIYEQWEEQLAAMDDYLIEYLQVDPEIVQANQATFEGRGREVQRVQEVVAGIGPTCS